MKTTRNLLNQSFAHNSARKLKVDRVANTILLVFGLILGGAGLYMIGTNNLTILIGFLLYMWSARIGLQLEKTRKENLRIQRLIDALEEIASTPEEGFPANHLKKVAAYALDEE